MQLYSSLSSRAGGRERRTRSGRQELTTASAPVVEKLESRCRSEMPSSFPVMIEALEPRVHLTATFNAYLVAPPTGSFGSAYTIELYTTGGSASKWVIHWGDGSTDTTINNPSSPQSATHTYSSSAPPTSAIKAVATLSTNSNVTATGYFALSNSFGNRQFQDSGESVQYPHGSTGNSGGVAMAIDTSGGTYNGYIYVASLYKSNQIAVTRFAPSGQVDTTFGSQQGTFVFDPFVTGTDTDVPTSIAVNGRYVAVAGSCSSGWAVGTIDTTGGSNGSGVVAAHAAGVFATGQANAVTFGLGGDVIAAGYENSSPTCMAVAALKPDTGVGDTSFGSNGSVSLTISGCNFANSVIQLAGNVGPDNGDILLGGKTLTSTYSDFTLVALTSTGSLDNNFGCCGISQVNFGNTIGTAHGMTNVPSMDSDYSLVEWYNSTAGAYDVTAVGSSNAQGSDHVALARFVESTGVLDTTYGPYSDGLALGPAGEGYGAALEDTNTTPGYIVTAGTSNNDFLVCRFKNTGDLDPNFGNAGVMLTDFGDSSTNSTDVAYSVVVLPGSTRPTNDKTDTILVGGSTTPSGSNAELALAEYLPENKGDIS